MTVRLVDITPDAEQRIADIARVSTNTPPGKPPERLIRRLLSDGHWSPLEMVHATLEVVTTRDVGRHFLRHSLRPQEFSQRYSEAFPEPVLRECRMEHPTDRQQSLPCDDAELAAEWAMIQEGVWRHCMSAYKWARKRRLARESARVVLPEGMTTTRMYLAGSIRDHLFCWHLRSGHGTQKETAEIAQAAWVLLAEHLPVTCAAFLDKVGGPSQ